MIVVDASAVAELLLRGAAALAVEHRVHDMRETLYAPHLIDAEVAQVVRRYTCGTISVPNSAASPSTI